MKRLNTIFQSPGFFWVACFALMAVFFYVERATRPLDMWAFFKKSDILNMKQAAACLVDWGSACRYLEVSLGWVTAALLVLSSILLAYTTYVAALHKKQIKARE